MRSTSRGHASDRAGPTGPGPHRSRPSWWPPVGSACPARGPRRHHLVVGAAPDRGRAARSRSGAPIDGGRRSMPWPTRGRPGPGPTSTAAGPGGSGPTTSTSPTGPTSGCTGCPTDADASAEPEPVTPEPAISHGWRWADGREHPDGTWLAAVREDHHGIGSTRPMRWRDPDRGGQRAGGRPPPTAGAEADPVVLVSGPDFVAAPRFSPDGRWLSWVEWDHPAMPWDSTRLMAAPVFANHRLGNPVLVAGGSDGAGGGPESVVGADWTSLRSAGLLDRSQRLVEPPRLASRGGRTVTGP